jgi:hypothetical protein
MIRPARRLRDPDAPPLALHDKAMENLRYIRETMERSQSFTAVSGVGGVVMGLIALAASVLAWRASDPRVWVLIWMAAAVLAIGVALVAMATKAHAAGSALLGGAGRKFAWNVSPPLVVGLLLTVALARAGLVELLPGAWLLLYGTGVVTGGAFSVRVVPAMGFTFMGAGALALFAPAAWADVIMAVGFGALHIVFGVIIWRKHGG